LDACARWHRVLRWRGVRAPGPGPRPAPGWHLVFCDAAAWSATRGRCDGRGEARPPARPCCL